MSPQLFQTTNVEEQWQSIVGPWLRIHAKSAWQDPRPTVILTPGRAESFYLRSRLVQEELSFLGLRFWTPSDARAFLLAQASPAIEPATQAELCLVARVCAENLLAASNPPEPSLASVAREPGSFLRAYDLLLGAGWQPAREGALYGRRLAQEMELTLAERGIATQAAVHLALRRQRSSENKSLLAHLLILGFNAMHWPLWDLLQASVAASADATVALLAPAVFAEEVDQLWISSWEETSGAAVEFPLHFHAPVEEPFSPWIASYEKGEPGDLSAGDVTFLATADLTAQVQAIVLQTLAYLRTEACLRLGIIFPEPNALALGVADQLRQLGIPLDDGTGFLRPGLFEQRPWHTWLKLQEEPSVQRLIEWARACEAGNIPVGLSAASLTARQLAGALEEALGECLVDDLPFLALQLEETSTHRQAREAAQFLRERISLPETATFAEFLAHVRNALQGLAWNDHLARVESRSPRWLRESSWTLSRRGFLEWLREATDSRERTRGAEGNHFYGKVHLVIYAQMPGQTWTHLILTGLNEGEWPRFSETGAFGSRHEWMELNRQARALNRRGTAQGRQGVGHDTARGHCLLPLERQELALRDLCAAVEGTSSSLCLTAMTTDAGRALLPSDFFNHAYQAKTDRVLDENTFRALAQTTAQWCHAHAAVFRQGEETGQGKPSIAATQIAYAARRDPEQPFGRYEFAFAEPPENPIQLSCKTWETAWNHPSTVWLNKIVGASAWPEGQLAWPRAVGTWVHRWLTAALRESKGENISGDFLRLLRENADREPGLIRGRAARAGVVLYPWWNDVWGQARAVALGLGHSLAPLLPERQILSEYRLTASSIALPGTDRRDFDLRGQIDLILIEPGAAPIDPAQGNFSDCACWVIDFKTGAASRLNVSRVEKGIGLQIMLYALYIHTAGALSVALSLHTPESPLLPQVQIEHVRANTRLFRSLDRLHRAGIFGMRPDAKNEYGFSPVYPMATRPISQAVLEAKWALVHGAGAWEEGA